MFRAGICMDQELPDQRPRWIRYYPINVCGPLKEVLLLGFFAPELCAVVRESIVKYTSSSAGVEDSSARLKFTSCCANSGGVITMS